MATIQKIMPCLWFDNRAEEAVKFYVGIFDTSRIVQVARYGKGRHKPEGTVMTIVFELAGQRFMALNGGPEFTFTEAISMIVDCADQAEIDRFWEKLGKGGTPVQCGWLKDKFGLSWQIVPSELARMFHDGTQEQADRVMTAIEGMVKLDLAGLRLAYKG